MIADTLLQHLNKVKRTGQGRWLACCPAHDDKNPSLAVRELDDGRVLVHCFYGCSVEEVLSAVGLTLADLFPKHEIEYGKYERRPFPATDILRAIALETLIVLVSANDMLTGKSLNETDKARLALAASRIQAALTAGGIQS
ncbi:MAG: CHC2 zinc finger domain-containing protein [Nitrosomonas sp.]|uniref:CHC2 zinc finger domain-containing protein n=1 Tax=Nitrosomonas sp. TaxID=42353 RepID=UPI00272EF567|nr:CHC2 zinc finger domain-containing protein [Nitrosomonas sp.]MDP1550511.1 CHC2 zinc finger domain-containing protein [Nitrosomonas sp.]